MNEFLSLSISNVLGLALLYLEIATPYTVCYSLFLVCNECTHICIK